MQTLLKVAMAEQRTGVPCNLRSRARDCRLATHAACPPSAVSLQCHWMRPVHKPSTQPVPAPPMPIVGLRGYFCEVGNCPPNLSSGPRYLGQYLANARRGCDCVLHSRTPMNSFCAQAGLPFLQEDLVESRTAEFH